MALDTDQYGYLIDPLVPITDEKGTTIKDGFLRVYIAGSSTPVITYRNFDESVNEKTIELDNSGRCKYPIIVNKSLAYKVVVYDAQHSQETPIITVDKMFAIGASVTVGAGATVVTGLDGLTTKPDGFVDTSVVGTDGYVAIDHTLVTDDLDTDAKVTAVEEDRFIPLLNEDVNDPDSKMTLGRLWRWVLGKIKSLSTTITAFRTGDVIPVDGPSGTAKMSKDSLLALTAQNAVDSKVAASAEYVGDDDEATPTWTDGKFIDKSNGFEQTYAGYACTDYIDVSGYGQVKTNAGESGNAGYAFYDSTQTFISGGVLANNDEYKVVTIPSGAKYIRLSNKNSTIPYASVHVYNETANFSSSISGRVNVLESSVTEITQDISDIVEDIGQKTTATITWTDGKFIDKSNGFEQTYAGYACTDYIDVSGYGQVKTNAGESGNAGYAFYDSSKTFVSGGVVANDSTYKTITIPSGVRYIRLSNKNSTIPYASVNVYLESSDFQNSLLKELNDVETTVSGTQQDIGDIVEEIGVSTETTTTWTDGEFIDKANGYNISYSGYSRTDYIDVSGYGQLEVNVAESGNAGYAFYDSSKVFSSGGVVANDSTYKVIAIPSGVKYIRISNRPSVVPNANVKIYLEPSGYSSSLNYRVTVNERNIAELSSDITGAENDITALSSNLAMKQSGFGYNTEIPIVTFVYDDGAVTDAWLCEKLEQRGLLASFALFGGVDGNASWETMANRYKGYIKKGHGVLVHGEALGLSIHNVDNVGYPTLEKLDENDRYLTLDTSIESFKKAGFPTNGFVDFNGHTTSDRVKELLRERFDFNVTYDTSKDGVNDSSVNFEYVTRYITDGASMLSGALTALEKASRTNCVMVFGGHSATIGTAGNVTQADFLSLLDAVAERVARKEFIAMNCNDAIATFRNRMLARNNLFASKNTNFPIFGDSKIESGVFKTCSQSSKKGAWSFEFSGTASETGTIVLNFPKDSVNTESITINVTNGDTAEEIVNTLMTTNAFSYHKVIRESTTKILVTRSSGCLCGSPSYTSISGISVSVSTIDSGADAVWV